MMRRRRSLRSGDPKIERWQAEDVASGDALRRREIVVDEESLIDRIDDGPTRRVAGAGDRAIGDRSRCHLAAVWRARRWSGQSVARAEVLVAERQRRCRFGVI